MNDDFILILTHSRGKTRKTGETSIGRVRYNRLV